MSYIDEVVSPGVKDRIAWYGELEFAGATEDDRTGRTVQFRLVRSPEELTEAHPFATYTRRRRGHAGTRFRSVFTPVGGGEPIEAEVMLLNWADGPGGATTKFLLDADLAEHPFMACSRRTKDSQPSLFMGVLMELDDDDRVINQAKRERFEKARQTLSNVAAMMVKHPHFHSWLSEVVAFPPELGIVAPEHWDAVAADKWLKHELGIKSKAELDGGNIAAQHKFLKLRASYEDWLDANKIDR